MYGPEHYVSAEQLLREVQRTSFETEGQRVDKLVAIAQVHATLALAAATALAGVPLDGGDTAAREVTDGDSWWSVAGPNSPEI